MNEYYEKNEFSIDGTKVKAEYSGGQSRNGDYAVDYILVTIGETELYAEMKPMKKDADTFLALQSAIDVQAKEKGIDLDSYCPLFNSWISYE